MLPHVPHNDGYKLHSNWMPQSPVNMEHDTMFNTIARGVRAAACSLAARLAGAGEGFQAAPGSLQTMMLLPKARRGYCPMLMSSRGLDMQLSPLSWPLARSSTRELG